MPWTNNIYLVAAEYAEEADPLLDLATGNGALRRQVVVYGLHHRLRQLTITVVRFRHREVLEREVSGRLEAAFVTLDHQQRVLLLVDLVRRLLDAVQALGDYRRHRSLYLHGLQHVVSHVLYSLLVQLL